MGGGPSGSIRCLGDHMGPSGLFDESSDDSLGGPKKPGLVTGLRPICQALRDSPACSSNIV